MGRVIRRVPLDFSWPMHEVWPGFLLPDRLSADDCSVCSGRGYSEHAIYFQDLWYGKLPFDVRSTGSVPFTPDEPVVRALAVRNMDAQAPDSSIYLEGVRLCEYFNSSWHCHLSPADFKALKDGDRLRGDIPGPIDLDRAFKLNRLYIQGFGHDAINAYIVVEARCIREGLPSECDACSGHGSIETYPGQLKESESWEPEEPPTGEGWQLWEDVSEGSPVSAVFETVEDFRDFLTDVYKPVTGPRLTVDQANGFIKAAWSPSFVATSSALISGEAMYGDASS